MLLTGTGGWEAGRTQGQAPRTCNWGPSWKGMVTGWLRCLPLHLWVAGRTGEAFILEESHTLRGKCEIYKTLDSHTPT